MRLRVAHLSNYYKKLERDLEEIQTLQKNMYDDRSYSVSLSNSLQEEAERISLLQEKICSQLIKEVPDFFLEELTKEAKTKQAKNSKPKTLAKSDKAELYDWPQEPVISLPSSFSALNTLENSGLRDSMQAKLKNEKKEKPGDIERSASEKSMEIQVEIQEQKDHTQKSKKSSFPFVFKKD